MLCCRKLSLARNIKCDTCQGKGTKSGRTYTCEVRRCQIVILAACCILVTSKLHSLAWQKAAGCAAPAVFSRMLMVLEGGQDQLHGH